MSGIFDYLRWLPEDCINRIYGDDVAEGQPRKLNHQALWACRAVFQSLSALAKNYVMRLIFISTEISASDLACWVSPGAGAGVHAKTIAELQELQIITQRPADGPMGGGCSHITMNPRFRTNLLSSLSSAAKPWSQESLHPGMQGQGQGEALNQPNLNEAFLNNHFLVHWEKMLYYLINPNLATPNNKVAAKDDVSNIVDNFLVYTKLLWKNEEYTGTGSNTQRIMTRQGYEFMLAAVVLHAVAAAALRQPRRDPVAHIHALVL